MFTLREAQRGRCVSGRWGELGRWGEKEEALEEEEFCLQVVRGCCVALAQTEGELCLRSDSGSLSWSQSFLITEL